MFKRQQRLKSFGPAISAVIIVAALQWTSWAQSQGTPDARLEKKNYNYGNWTKGRFSEVVTVTGPGKLIFLAGAGSEEEMDGAILHKDSFIEQCRYAYSKVKKLLALHGATMDDIIKQTVYIVDVRNQPDSGRCRAEAFQGASIPASTSVYVTALAWPYMMFEVEIMAVVPR
jgi:2-iminobutanoate/2-iminopropanoate deaminase